MNETTKFIADVAADFGFTLTAEQMNRAIKVLTNRVSPDSADFYYATKEYFGG